MFWNWNQLKYINGQNETEQVSGKKRMTKQAELIETQDSALWEGLGRKVDIILETMRLVSTWEYIVQWHSERWVTCVFLMQNKYFLCVTASHSGMNLLGEEGATKLSEDKK